MDSPVPDCRREADDSDSGTDDQPTSAARPRDAASIFASSPKTVGPPRIYVDPGEGVDFFEVRPRSTGSQIAAPQIVFSSPEEDDNAEIVDVVETPLMLGMPTLMVSHRPRSPSVCEPSPVPPPPKGTSAAAPTVDSMASPPVRPRAPSQPVASNLVPHYGTMPRHGFPQSHNPAVAAAESQYYRTVAMQQLSLCEQIWGPALRGVQMLAHSVPTEVLPLRRLARKYGIPPHVRGIMWLTLSGVAHRAEENQG